MNDFQEWKRHPITVAVFSELKARMDLLMEQIVEQVSTVSHEAIAEKAGAIKALRDLLNITIEELPQETDE